MEEIIKNWRRWVRSVRLGEVKCAHLATGQNIRTVRCAANVINSDRRDDGRDLFIHIRYEWQERIVIAYATTLSEIKNYDSPYDWKAKIKQIDAGHYQATGDGRSRDDMDN